MKIKFTDFGRCLICLHNPCDCKPKKKKELTMPNSKPRFQFSNVVVIEDDLIGVILKTWDKLTGDLRGYNYDVYVRSFNKIVNYKEDQIKHFVYSKELEEEEKEFYL